MISTSKAVTSDEECVVNGCTNRPSEGRFEGALCSPCFSMLTTGIPGIFGHTFVHELQRDFSSTSRELAQVKQELRMLRSSTYGLKAPADGEVSDAEAVRYEALTEAGIVVFRSKNVDQAFEAIARLRQVKRSAASSEKDFEHCKGCLADETERGRCQSHGCKMQPDPWAGKQEAPAGSLREEKVVRPLADFRQTEPDPDHSTLHCPCGSEFTWSGLDGRLFEWQDQHVSHLHAYEGRLKEADKTTAARGGLSDEQLVVACRNIGFDLTCGACAMLFYTGYTGPTARHDMMPSDHTCDAHKIPEPTACLECKGSGWRECHEESGGHRGFGGTTPCECGAPQRPVSR